jgi:hypothetical protein
VSAKRKNPPFADAGVKAVFDAYPPKLRAKLVSLRALIFTAAAKTQGVGTLTERLKWGQPSYLTAASGSGTTIRIDRVKASADRYALYVHCQTDLVATFRQLYPQSFAYDGNRSIVFALDDRIDEGALRHCMSLALTYHRRKRG